MLIKTICLSEVEDGCPFLKDLCNRTSLKIKTLSSLDQRACQILNHILKL